MRPFYALLVWVLILGGLWAYIEARDAFDQPATTAIHVQPAPGEYALELTPTFDATGGIDPFALEPTAKSAIVVRLNGREIVRFEENAPAGIPQRFTWNVDDAPVEVGRNELNVELSTPEGDARALRGVRVRLLRDDATIADEMIWSQPGAPVMGDVDLIVPPAPADVASANDHE
jgi:hypothetical protein